MDKTALIQTLRQQLHVAKEERLKATQSVDATSARYALKTYQSNRLRMTHVDLLTAIGTKKAAEFFLTELYGTKDLTQRDKDIEKLLPIMETTFPLNTLEAITQAMILDSLSETLDSKMAQKLGSSFTEEQYMNAFREVADRATREKQITLVESLGYSLSKLVRIPFLATTLKVMRIPAKMAGVYDLHEFLETGFTIFQNTNNPELFVQTLVARERKILANIYENKETPFSLK